jgi:hypothetical protein
MSLSSTPATRTLVALVAAASVAGCAARMPAKDAASVRPAGAAASPEARSIEALSLASSLAGYGQRTGSALALATAAQLLLDNPAAALTETPQAALVGTAMQAAPKSADAMLDVARLLSSAQTLGRDNPHVTALVGQLQQRNASGAKGATYGARSNTYSVPANSTHTFNITFNGGEYAGIRVVGDGDTDLDCSVYDSSGRLVASDNDYTDYCVLDFYPRTTNQHRLTIRNWGDVYNRYQLITN